MMGLVREWLLGIAGAAILAALAQGAMPEGGVKQVGKLVCGLVLLSAVLRPLKGADVTDLFGELAYDETQVQAAALELREEADGRMKSIIEERLGAYSMDKAAGMGLACQVEVSCEADGDGAFLPVSAQVFGELDSVGRQALLGMLRTDLGLEEERVAFSGEGAP